MDDPDGEAEILDVADALHGTVADPDVLVAHTLEAEVGVVGAELAGS